jgi:two-component sensor histidine kinase
MKHWLSILLFSLFLSSTAGANNEIDALKLLVNSSSNDSILVESYMQLGIQYATFDQDSSFYFYGKAEKICETNQWHSYEGKVLINLAFDIYYGSGSDTSIQLMNRAIALFKKVPVTNNLMIAYYNRGVFLSQFGSYVEALESYELALSLKEQLNLPVYESYCLNNMAKIYQDIGAYDKAIEFILASIKLKKELAEPTIVYSFLMLAKNYESINEYELAISQYKETVKLTAQQSDSGRTGVSLRGQADNFIKLNQLDSSRLYLDKAFALFQVLGYKDQLALCYLTEAAYLTQINDFSGALSALSSAEKILPKDEFSSIRGSILFQKAKLVLESKPSATAIKSAIADAKTARDIFLGSDQLEELTHTNATLYNLYQLTGNKDSALLYAQRYILLNESLLNKQTLEAVKRLHIEYGTEKRIAKIAQLNIENDLKEERLVASEKLDKAQQVIIGVLTSGLAVLSILFYIIWRIFKSNKRAHNELKVKSEIIEKQNTEREYLLKEIHHRVKNNLQIISSLIDMQMKGVEDERLRATLIESRSRVASMALIHQMLYEGNNESRVKLQSYVTELTKHIAQSFGKQKEVRFEIIISEELSTNIETAIPFGLIITELATNSFKYAFENATKPIINVSVDIEKNAMKLVFADNGCGLPDGFEIENAKSLGLRLVKNLTQQLKGQLTYRNNEGATYSISFFERHLE